MKPIIIETPNGDVELGKECQIHIYGNTWKTAILSHAKIVDGQVLVSSFNSTGYYQLDQVRPIPQPVTRPMTQDERLEILRSGPCEVLKPNGNWVSPPYIIYGDDCRVSVDGIAIERLLEYRNAQTNWQPAKFEVEE